MASIEILVPLQDRDWQPPSTSGDKGQWKCSALSWPTARFVGLVRNDGSEVGEESFVRRGKRIIWKGGGQPHAVGMNVRLQLGRRLFSGFALAFTLALGIAGGLLIQEHRAEVDAFLDLIPTKIALFEADSSSDSV